jgi:hypothetical protein
MNIKGPLPALGYELQEEASDREAFLFFDN